MHLHQTPPPTLGRESGTETSYSQYHNLWLTHNCLCLRLPPAVFLAVSEGGEEDDPQHPGGERRHEPAHPVCPEDHQPQNTGGVQWRCVCVWGGGGGGGGGWGGELWEEGESSVILHTPVFHSLSPPGSEEQQAFVLELEGFIGRLLRMVEVELNFDFAKHGKITEQIHGM